VPLHGALQNKKISLSIWNRLSGVLVFVPGSQPRQRWRRTRQLVVVYETVGTKNKQASKQPNDLDVKKRRVG
jgi:hypothetical protein